MPSRIARPSLLMKGTLLSATACLLAGVTWMAPPAGKADSTDLLQLLDTRSCPGCKLQDADLVHADLRDADLRQAQLQRANLGQARLDGAQLSGANLSFTSLKGASLRGADLRGARLDGTDLRQADLSGAVLDPGALSRSHWQQATGIEPIQLSYAQLHNAGAEAARQGRYPEAEAFFSAAIRRDAAAALSWVARGICRGEQGKNELAANDFNYAASLYAERGEQEQALQLKQAAESLVAATQLRQSCDCLIARCPHEATRIGSRRLVTIAIHTTLNVINNLWCHHND